MSPTRYPPHISGTDETFNGKRVFADRMKLMILRGGDNSDYSSGLYIQWTDIFMKEQQWEKNRKDVDPQRGRQV